MNTILVNAVRFNPFNQEDLFHYNGNPFTAPLGVLRTGYSGNISNEDQTVMTNAQSALGRFPGAYMSMMPAPSMYLAADGKFVMFSAHAEVALDTLPNLLEAMRKNSSSNVNLAFSSTADVPVGMGGPQHVVTFEPQPGGAVHFKLDKEKDKWVALNRLTNEWVEPNLKVGVDGQFRIESIDLVRLTVMNDGVELHITLDSEGYIQAVTVYENDEHLEYSAFTLADNNGIFKYLIPDGWEPAVETRGSRPTNRNNIRPIGGSVY